MSDKCLNLKVIPQFGGTCWLNSILMSSLYSQGSQYYVKKASKKWDKNNSLLRFFKKVIFNIEKNPKLVQKLFRTIKPEIILFKLIQQTNDKDMIDIFNTNDITEDTFAYFIKYIVRFYKSLGLKVLDVYNMASGTTRINLCNLDEYYYTKKTNITNVKITFDIDKFIHDTTNKEKTKKIVNDVPDIIVLFSNKIYEIGDLFNLYNLHKPIFKDNVLDDIVDSDIKGVDTYEDIIEINSVEYKLDSVLITNFNYNEIKSAHAIAGITCNNNKYVYNGWTKTYDPALKNQVIKGIDASPCSLMKYDWDLKKDKSFCLNSKTCKLDFVENPDDLCFSFGIDNKEGRRYLVYVRVKEYEKMKTTEEEAKLSIPENLKISGVSDIIKDIHDIKNLTNEELIEQLGKLGIALVPDFPYDKQTLQGLLYDALAEYYDISPEIIQEFRKKRTTPIKRELKKIKKYHYSEKLSSEKEEEEEEYNLKEKINLQRQLEKQLKTITKDDLLKRILSKYPDITGITSKNKLELLEILIYGESLEKDMKNKNRIPKYKSKDELIAILIKKLPKLTKTKMEELISII